MRKFISAAACAVLLLSVQSTADAQTIGFKVGPTWSEMDVDPDQGEEQDRLTSFGGGGFVRFGFAGLSLQAELLAFTKGAKQSLTFDEEFEDEITGELKLQYIEIPLTAMISFGSGPYIFGGPAIAFESGCTVKAEFEGVTFEETCDEGNDGEDEGTFARKKVDFGLVGGAGFQFPVGPGAILLEGRYTHGLSNLSDDPNEDIKVRNRSIAVMAGYSIPLGKR